MSNGSFKGVLKTISNKRYYSLSMIIRTLKKLEILKLIKRKSEQYKNKLKNIFKTLNSINTLKENKWIKPKIEQI